MWTNETLNLINNNIVVGLNIDTSTNLGCVENSNDRVIISRGNCTNYDYNNSDGFYVRIGVSNIIQIPISMLQNCYIAACNNNNIYNKEIFQQLYPRLIAHGCHVTVVGMIFYHACLVRQINGFDYILI